MVTKQITYLTLNHMPNWCSNLLIIGGNTRELGDLISKYTSKENDEEQCIDFEKIAPTPEELSNNSSPISDDPEGIKAKAFKKKYGATDWYNWNNKNWGTKWLAKGYSFEDNGTEIVFGFDTAWAPPYPIIKKLSKLYPDLKLTLTYAEPGCCFAGKQKYKNGKQMTNIITEDINHPLFKEFGYGPEEQDN